MRLLIFTLAIILLIGCVTQMGSSITISTNPPQPVAGQPTTLSFSLTENGKPLELQTHHERKLHTVIVSDNFNVFGHIHPEDFGKEKEVQFTFPQFGKYGVAIDFMANNTPGNKLFNVQVNGNSLINSAITNSNTTRCFTSYPEEGNDKYTKPFILSQSEVVCSEGYQFQFTYHPDSQIVAYHVQKEGQLVTFDPYLGEVMHLAIVDQGFNQIIHTHAIATGNGMYESVPLQLKTTGKYYVFSQSKQNGQIVVTRFEFNGQQGSVEMPPTPSTDHGMHQ